MREVKHIAGNYYSALRHSDDPGPEFNEWEIVDTGENFSASVGNHYAWFDEIGPAIEWVVERLTTFALQELDSAGDFLRGMAVQQEEADDD